MRKRGSDFWLIVEHNVRQVAHTLPIALIVHCAPGGGGNRVTRSLYARAVGYNYEATKIFMPANRQKPIYAKYIEHVPPDVTAGIFWLKNRDPEHWRDSQKKMEHVLGRYIISDRPMTEEEWARERATVIDAEPVTEEDVTRELPKDRRHSRITCWCETMTNGDRAEISALLSCCCYGFFLLLGTTKQQNLHAG